MNSKSDQQILHNHGNYLVRRQRLRPGEATAWHRDPFHRVTVVLSGDQLGIEFRDTGETLTLQDHSWRGRLVGAERPRSSGTPAAGSLPVRFSASTESAQKIAHLVHPATLMRWPELLA